MLTAFYDEEVVSVGEDTLTLAVDMGAIDLMEHIVGDPEALTPATIIVAHILYSSPVPISMACKVLYSLLRRHHQNVSLDMCLGLVADKQHSPRVALAMQTLLRRAFNFDEEPEKAKDKNPRKRRGASVTS